MTLLVPPQWSLRQAVEAVDGELETYRHGGAVRWVGRVGAHTMDSCSPIVVSEWLETLGAVRHLTEAEAVALGAALGGPVPDPCARCGERVYVHTDEVEAWVVCCYDCGDGAPDGGFNSVDALTVTDAITRWNDQQAEERGT